MYSIDILQNRIKEEITSLNFSTDPVELYEPINYTLSLGGKRLRPVLTLMACNLFGSEIEKAINAALGLEIFHNFTLLHDDIMDKSPIRRGQATVYKKWNTNIAILSGDTMFALAYEYIAKTDDKLLKVLNVFTQTAKQVCEGQQYDMNFETASKVEIADYINMIRLKTAVLIGACLKIGAICGGATEKDADNIYQFGQNIGLAFQLKDDLLDVFADEEKFGKKTGNDIVTNKKTYLYLKAFELANDEQNKILNCYFNDMPHNEVDKVKAVKEIYNQLNIKELTEAEMKSFYGKAMQNLQDVDVKDNRKTELKSFADNLFYREF